MGNYTNLLEFSFEDMKSFLRNQNMTRHSFIADAVFNLSTYDSELDEIFVTKCLEISNTIGSGATFEYIKNKTNHIWFIGLLHLQFFQDNTDYGTSPRGSWWEYPITLHTYQFSDPMSGEQIAKLTFDKLGWSEFLTDVQKFLKGGPTK